MRTGLFAAVSVSKAVTVNHSGSPGAYGATPTDTTTNNWGNAFRGKGWNGTDGYLGGTVNANVAVSISP